MNIFKNEYAIKKIREKLVDHEKRMELLGDCGEQFMNLMVISAYLSDRPKEFIKEAMQSLTDDTLDALQRFELFSHEGSKQ